MKRRKATEGQSLVSRVKALAEALEGSEVSELDLTEDGLRTYLRRRMEATIVVQPSARHATRSRTARRDTASQNGTGGSSAEREPGIPILAPLTGVFYASPSPNADSFVQVGEVVQAGQVVCIIEAMKVFNEIKSEVSGTLVKVLAQSGQLVRKGDPVLLVKV